MELAILDTNFDRIAEIDDYISLIWNESFKEAGDFEIYLPQDSPLVQHLKKGNYIWKQDTDRVMMVRKIRTATDSEEGSKAIITGRTLEWILHSRVAYEQIDSATYENNLENYIKAILMSNLINPSISARKITNFIFAQSDDSAISDMTIEDQTTIGENIYDKIVNICNAKEIGFRVFLTSDNKFEFKLYAGVDRTYGQTDNVYVIFSPEYDNLLESDYYTDADSVKTSAIIAGSKTENYDVTDVDGKTYSFPIPQIVTTIGDDFTDLNREELFVDKGDVSRFFTVSNGNQSVKMIYEYSVYANMLKQGGQTELDKYQSGEIFDAKVDPYGQFEYGKDFFIGDRIQIRDAFGREGVAVVASYMVSHGPEGYDAYPTFEIKEENQNGG